MSGRASVSLDRNLAYHSIMRNVWLAGRAPRGKGRARGERDQAGTAWAADIWISAGLI